MDMVGNGNNIIGNYKVSASGIPAYYDSKEGVYLRVNFTNSIKQSFLLRINATCLDLRYVLMRSSEPTKYPYSDEHYRIEFKNPSLQFPCSLDNMIVHEGFLMNFEWYLYEAVEWKWRCMKPEQKQKKKQSGKQRNSKAGKKPKRGQPKRSKLNKATSTPPTPTPKPSHVQSKPTPVCKKQVKAPKLSAAKKKVRLMSQTKFDELILKVQMNLTCTKKERETYAEQRVLRKLKRFLG